MDISEKQAKWRQERPLFEAELIHSHLLPFFNFNENTGDYEIKVESVANTDDEDRKVAYETLNTGWVMWLRAKRNAKASAVPVVVSDIQSWIAVKSFSALDVAHENQPIIDANELAKYIDSLNLNVSVPEGFVLVPGDQFESLSEFKELYKRAIINAKKRKGQLNWAHVAGLGVGSGRAVELCKILNIDPCATNMYVMIEAQEPVND